MRAIRQVNPAAHLIQTEDLAKAHSTPALAYQARHENARRG
jgi:dTDP-4-dehydrorhamnose reductase